MIYFIYLVASLALPFLISYLVKQYRKGKTVAGGAVRIAKGPNDTVFKSEVRLNGRKVTGLFDTGASETTIGIGLAERIGIDPSSLYFDTSTETAAGTKHGAIAKVVLDQFQVGPITIRNMGIGVNRLVDKQCLVGMNFFDSLDSFEINGNVLTLKKSSHAANTQRASAGRQRPGADGKTKQPRIVVDCPYCDARMAVPLGRKGKVRCRRCQQLFQADSTNVKAKSEKLR